MRFDGFCDILLYLGWQWNGTEYNVVFSVSKWHGLWNSLHRHPFPPSLCISVSIFLCPCLFVCLSHRLYICCSLMEIYHSPLSDRGHPWWKNSLFTNILALLCGLANLNTTSTIRFLGWVKMIKYTVSMEYIQFHYMCNVMRLHSLLSYKVIINGSFCIFKFSWTIHTENVLRRFRRVKLLYTLTWPVS